MQTLLWSGVTPPVSAQLYRRELLREVGGYDERVMSGVDHDLWISLAVPNPRLAIVWADGPSVGRSLEVARMTNQEAKRRAKIAEALRIWRPRLEALFGRGFYRYFCRSYEQYLAFTFFRQALKARRYREALTRMAQPSIWPALGRRARARLTGRRRCAQFPPYDRRRVNKP